MKLGEKWEGLAVKFLKKKGYKRNKQNYKTPIGEVDIIAKEGETRVFIEVKTRESVEYGLPFEAVKSFKRRTIVNVALLYLKSFKEIPPCRFDVISIYYEKGKPEFELIKEAFEI